MPIWLAKIVVTRIYKAIKHNRELKKIDDYVNKPNELDKKFKSLQKTVNKNAKYIEELEKNVANLKKDSHPAQEYICCRKCGCKIAKSKIKNKEK